MTDDMQLRGFSPKTIYAYTSHVKRFEKHFEKHSARMGEKQVRLSLLVPFSRFSMMLVTKQVLISRLGAHTDCCDECGHIRISYNSCRNRHCPKCQGLAREQWISDRQQDLLPVPYFHVVFTLPDLLNPIVLRNQKLLYDLLFQCVSETLSELAADEKYLGAQVGFTTILHT